jgi:hypothetical protein
MKHRIVHFDELIFFHEKFRDSKHNLIRKNEQIRIQNENDIINNDLNNEFSIWR